MYDRSFTRKPFTSWKFKNSNWNGIVIGGRIRIRWKYPWKKVLAISRRESDLSCFSFYLPLSRPMVSVIPLADYDIHTVLVLRPFFEKWGEGGRYYLQTTLLREPTNSSHMSAVVASTSKTIDRQFRLSLRLSLNVVCYLKWRKMCTIQWTSQTHGNYINGHVLLSRKSTNFLVHQWTSKSIMYFYVCPKTWQFHNSVAIVLHVK